MATITIPHKFKPRDYQLNFLKALDSGITRAIIVWNRRSGKDKVCFNYLVRKAIEKVGTYYYFLPSYNQSKKVIWDNIDNEGFKMLDHIPKQAIKKTNSTELKIELINGSIIQLISADEFKKSGVGANPIGVVFSEYSISSPEAWQFVSPILAANNGWAIFNFTPRGKNHAWKLLEQAKTNEKWFTEILTIEDTKVLSDEALEEVFL
jgi:phage terminase large subunit